MSLKLDNVVLTYQDGAERLTAVDHVDLEVRGGTVTALVGPSGSGKSSLLAVAAALITPDSGEVVVNDVSITASSRAEQARLRRERIGIVFQQPNLIGSLTAAEQLEVMARMDGVAKRAARQRARELLDAVGLADRAGHRPHQLSGGQQQRVNIARALVNDPGVLLVDEPTSALDRQRGAAVVELLTTLTRARGTATVLVTHDEQQLSGMDRVVEMHDGKLQAATPA